MSHRLARALVPALVVCAVGGAAASSRPAQAASTPGMRPATTRSATAVNSAAEGLLVAVNERGHISRSIAGVVSDGPPENATVTKPAGATVRKAYLATATTGYTGYRITSPVQLNGHDVPVTGEIPNGIGSYNYLADVTDLVKSTLDADPAGPASVSYSEPDPYYVDGSILEVIWDDPSVIADQSVTILYGALKTTGDTYSVHLASPVNPSDPATKLEMSLGISYSYQSGGAQQYSIVDVNGQRMTTSAGGEDDGRPYNGALLTVGGEGDSPANPTDPYATPTNPRSDDELYDLRPFVKDGDTTIQVQTQNPSGDDNIFLATFTMNPPATVTTGAKPFVYVALGDSYQSGEGAAVDLHPASNYLANGYENGLNYPDAAGSQEDTYTQSFSGIDPANACHRALLNYAKINRDKLAPGRPVVLIDRTCSGAQIVAANKPPIVGPFGGGIAPDSQVQTALDRLATMNLTGGDVNLVTVGMGGNDARFGDILTACVGPSLVEALLKRYPNAPGEITWLTQNLATCKNVDQYAMHTDTALKDLAAKESDAETKIQSVFPTARIMQLDYPNILPSGASPSWCGGLRAGDIDYAKQRIIDINDRIRQAAASTGTEVVDVQNAFGPNALCPVDDASRLANGISGANFDTEVTRLLNLDGTGDAVARAKLDTLVQTYQDLKNCWATELNPFAGSCDTNAAKNRVQAALQDLLDYLQNREHLIFSNIMSRPGTTDDTVDVGFDRSRGLFHPNAAGFAVDACVVLAQYNGTGNCDTVGAPPSLPAGGDGTVLTGLFGQLLRIIVGNFSPNSPVTLTMYSQPVPLGTVTADANGQVDTTLTMPDLEPGVHRLILSGHGAGDTQIEQELLVRIAGRPTGSYTTYLTGFSPRPSTPTPNVPIEMVDLTLNGTPVGSVQVDDFGGALVSLPSVDLLRGGQLTLTATSEATGKVVTQTFSPVPTHPALWARSTGADALAVRGARFVTDGLVHSEGGATLSGSADYLSGGLEYVAGLRVDGNKDQISPEPIQLSAGGGAPRPPSIGDFRPGAALANAAASYTAIPPSACVGGVWTPSDPAALSGVVYVPCAVNLALAGRYAATIVAEGVITVSASSVMVGPGSTNPGAPALVGTSVALHGADTTVLGQTIASASLEAHGARTALTCGAVADTIALSGADASARMEPWCLPAR